MTRYYVDMSPSMASQVNSGELNFPEGWRLIERWGPRYKCTERWIVEDDYAGEEFEGYLVMPVFTMTLIGDGPDYITEVSGREILAAPH